MTNKTFSIVVLAVIAVGSMATTASAIIGRPMTPMSYGGVARRTTYRAVDDRAVAGVAVAGAAVAGEAVVGAAAYTNANEASATACVAPAYLATAYNAYGQAYAVCR